MSKELLWRNLPPKTVLIVGAPFSRSRVELKVRGPVDLTFFIAELLYFYSTSAANFRNSEYSIKLTYLYLNNRRNETFRAVSCRASISKAG